jgi:hypothetical protein
MYSYIAAFPNQWVVKLREVENLFLGAMRNLEV